MIFGSGELIRELCKMGEDFISVELDQKEYVIDSVTRRKNYTDSPSSHICLKCRDGGDGEIKR